ncbi:MAG: O-antigen ligase family protein [Bacteroidota bacterium]
MAKTNKKALQAAVVAPDRSGQNWQIWLWLSCGVNALFLIPQCLDRFLVPRFFFLSLVLLLGGYLLRRDLRMRGDWRLQGFDALLLAWYGLNIASVFWAFSWSEAVFYTQKVLLLLLMYWLIRQAAFIDEKAMRNTMRQITILLTYTVAIMLSFQIYQAFSEFGFNNEKLYDYAVGVFGNKSLATDFLFILLIFNLLFFKEFNKKSMALLSVGLLVLLILLLQTRAVYLAVLAAALVYAGARALGDAAFRPLLFKKIVPATLILVGLLAVLVAFKGKGNSLAERMNPATYLESISANERRFVWYKTDILNQQHYWLGVGNGSWKLWFPSNNIQGGYRLQEQNVVFTRAHNDYLEVRAEMGIVGAVLFILLFGAAFFSGFLVLRRAPDLETLHDVPVILAGLAGYCVIQYFDFPRERIELQAALGLLFGLLAHRTRRIWLRLPSLEAARYAGFLGTLAALGLAFNLLIGWYRIQGEIHNVNMLKAGARNDYRTMADEAEAALNPFYEYDDVVLPMPYHLGLALFHQEDMAASMTAFEAAYRLNPWSFAVMNNYASALAQNNRFRDAVPLLEKTVEINPKFDEGKLNLAYLWMRLGDSAQSMQWYNKVDTIVNPQTEPDRRKNAGTKEQQAAFMKLWNDFHK